MGTKNLFILRTDFYFPDRGFVCKNMFWLLGLVRNSLLFVLGSLMRCFSRIQESEESEPTSGSDSRAREDNQTDSGLGENETSELGFVDSEDKSSPISRTSKYEFISGRNMSEFVEEPRIMSLTIQEMFTEKQICGFQAVEDEDSVLTFSFGMVPEKKAQLTDEQVGSGNDVLGRSDEAQLHSKIEFFPEQNSISTEDDLGGCELQLGDKKNEGFGCETACVVTGDELLEFEAVNDSQEEEEAEQMDEPQRPSFDDSEEEEADETEQMEGQSFDDSEDVIYDQMEGESFDDDVGWDLISEHQDLIEQLKIELKNVRIGGLPTILEESESPKIVEDLQPLKIDHKKLDHKDRMEQIQKVHKNYVEKMRKLDILSYQTIHAIGFIRRKDQSELLSVRKPSAMKFPFLQNMMGSKARMVGDDPVGELERDLELVYVGQACLSWKILHWQYEKAKELCDHDPHGFRQYNQVAGKFQLFQVLVQRYVEDETFQGPRVQHYVNNRCIIRSLLQVPVIRDDKKGRKGEEESAISSAMLREIIHQCMRVFWAFLQSDKKGINAISQHVQVELQNPADKTLLIEVQTDVQKKERKLKDILRSGNCIVKKFQKHNQRETSLDHTLFIAQVELRLVSRVLSMSKITSQQLFWCHEQLGMINFTSRKVYLEPCFLLFPC